MIGRADPRTRHGTTSLHVRQCFAWSTPWGGSAALQPPHTVSSKPVITWWSRLCRAVPPPGEAETAADGGDWADVAPAASTQHDQRSGPARQGSRSQLNVGARDYMPPAQSPPPPLPSVAATVQAAAAAPPPPMPPPQRAEEARYQPPPAQSGPPNGAPNTQARFCSGTNSAGLTPSHGTTHRAQLSPIHALARRAFQMPAR